MNCEHPSYYAIIPANVRYDKTLLPQEKLMFGEITCLSSKFGYCSASNNYFAKLYSASNDSVSRWIANLKKRGYVKTYVDRKNGNKRRIYMQSVIKTVEQDELPIGTDADRYRQESVDLSAQMPQPIGIDADKCININTKSNSIPKVSKQEQDEFRALYSSLYKKTYSYEDKYVFIGKDYTNMTNIIRQYPADWRGALEAFFANKWYTKDNPHTFGSFVKNIARYINAKPAAPAPRTEMSSEEFRALASKRKLAPL